MNFGMGDLSEIMMPCSNRGVRPEKATNRHSRELLPMILAKLVATSCHFGSLRALDSLIEIFPHKKKIRAAKSATKLNVSSAPDPTVSSEGPMGSNG
jgi:hypothetical protein